MYIRCLSKVPFNAESNLDTTGAKTLLFLTHPFTIEVEKLFVTKISVKKLK